MELGVDNPGKAGGTPTPSASSAPPALACWALQAGSPLELCCWPGRNLGLSGPSPAARDQGRGAGPAASTLGEFSSFFQVPFPGLAMVGARVLLTGPSISLAQFIHLL